jgi:NADPH-dependent 2,4-dienoyl-CoA reductase/sulfur reductase-like enzyme
MRKIGDHAVVVGAGLAGLLATRVLAEAYEWVTVVERDPLPIPIRVVNAYIDRLLTAAEHDPAVAEEFLRVATLQRPPTRLFRPVTALRVLRGARRRGRVPAVGAAHTAAPAGSRALEERA